MRRTLPFILKPSPPSRGFSLLEVVVAVGIFAVGMVAVIGLFTPVARSVGQSADTEAAARVAEALRIKLQSMPPADVVKLLKNSIGANGHEITVADGRVDYDLTRDAQLLFARRDGMKIGTYADEIWMDPVTRRNLDREKYFEIALIRNEAISPKPVTTTAEDGTVTTTETDSIAPIIAYTARLRWPAFISDGSATGAIQNGSNPNATVRFDHSRKQVMFVSGAVLR